ncbi:MAG: methylated-DNA--[protein]-cysteine S-methyltransferase [Bacilli bacterium]|jgi:methylated-DNA-[protein]-cysteine S-methyltransferase
MVYESYGDTIIGVIKIRAQDNYITDIELVAKKKKGHENALTKECAKQLEEYFKGIRTSFEMPLLLKGTAFQQKVWQALMTIPYGETISYKEIAKRIGHEKAVRAVGNAIGKNPCLIVVPCHRVINSNGNLGGFSSGLNIKKKLLKLEGRKNGN